MSRDLPEQLRTIADRLDEADEAKRAALADLDALLGGRTEQPAEGSDPPVGARVPREGGPVVAPRGAPRQDQARREPARAEAPTAIPSAPPQPVTDCPDCGRYLGGPANIGRHRRFCKGKPAPAANGHAKESFLCSRCPEAFPTRELQMRHLADGHPPETRGNPIGHHSGEPGAIARGAVQLA